MSLYRLLLRKMASPSTSTSLNVANLVRQAGVVFRKSAKNRSFEQELHKLRDMMKKITPEDLNISPQLIKESWDFPPFVVNAKASCMDVYECPDFSIGIFMMKANAKMPLHDHPRMHGMMKILFGSMILTSYNLMERQRAGYSARCCAVETMTSQSEPCCLYPDLRNVHEIQAQEDAVAFLDILGPPYDPKNGRDCTYYHRQPSSTASAKPPQVGHVEVLTPGKNPSWFSCVPLPYPGRPKIPEDVTESS